MTLAQVAILNDIESLSQVTMSDNPMSLALVAISDDYKSQAQVTISDDP